MDGYLQSTLAANSVSQNASRNNTPNALPSRPITHFPLTNKEFSCTEISTPEGIYPLLHQTFIETIAPQFPIGTRASVVSLNEDYRHSYNTDHSEDEISHSPGTGFGSALLTMTPVKSAALPIPNTIRSTASVGNSIKNSNGLQILTSPQKIMTTTASGNNSSPYFPYSPSYPTTPTFPSTSTQSLQHQHQQQHQFASGSYMMSSSHDLGVSLSPLPQQQQTDYGFPSSYTNVASSVSSLSSLFARTNPTNIKPASQLSASIARSMGSSSNSSKPKTHLAKTTSAFVVRLMVHDQLQKLLSSKSIDTDLVFFNLGSSFIWMDPVNYPKEALSRIVFSKSYPTCHDINETTRCEDHVDIIIGFSTGDIIWYEPLSCRYTRINKGGTLVNASVAMVKWVPGSDDLFIAVFKNGAVMVMDKERDDQTFNMPEPCNWVEAEFLTHRPHRNSKYNPVSVWKVGDKALTDLCFSPDGVHMAITGSDGKLRIIDYRNERLLDVYSSYFGAFTCVDWSPDGRYILTGGEDDYVSIWSFFEKRVIARCEGHKSFVTGVMFDRWRCDEQNYRFGSVGEDAHLIFWDFSFGALQKPKHTRVATSPLLYKTEPDASPLIPITPINIERKKSLKSHRFLRSFSTTEVNSSSGSFGRFMKRSSRPSNSYSQQEYADDMVEEQIKQHLPVLHPPLKKTQAAILLPTSTREAHPDPCLSLLFRENTIVTTDRRGRTFTWGRP